MSVFTSHLSTTTHTSGLTQPAFARDCIGRTCITGHVTNLHPEISYGFERPANVCKDVPRSHVWLLGQNILVGPELQVPSWYLSRVFQSRRNREPMGLVCSLGQLRSGSEVFPSLAPPKLPLFGPTSGVLDLGTFGPVVFQASPPGSVRSGGGSVAVPGGLRRSGRLAGARVRPLVETDDEVEYAEEVDELASDETDYQLRLGSMSPLEGSLGAPEVTTTGHTPPTPLVSLPSSPGSARSDSMSPVTSPGVDHMEQPQDPRSPSVHQQQHLAFTYMSNPEANPGPQYKAKGYQTKQQGYDRAMVEASRVYRELKDGKWPGDILWGMAQRDKIVDL
ncbi:hypothetical protein BDB00DRAFT_878340 [Zychaea mexicana]|uniref:uncharacterized protein n=1 Tax=Zychaea mexicana TaxID=64656 RepID=UPI0022FEBCB7|nr:uncharacterized protein BDB00DRAFT_878340 [Zychaea mexicana]KAI9484921.1 hypothetical protein BDB00DRAFT_878340 [Zychaea mexicana]